MTGRMGIGLGEVALGTARVGDLDVAFMQAPTGEGRHVHWWLAAGDDGVAFARKLTPGPLVPGRPDASLAEIVAELSKPPAPAELFGNAIVGAFRQGFEPTGVGCPMLRTLTHAGVAIVGRSLDEDKARIEAALQPVRERLGWRWEAIRHHAAQQGTVEYRKPTLTSVEAVSRVLGTTAAEAAGLAALGPFHPLLREAIDLPGTRLDDSAEEIQRSVLVELGVSPAAARRARRAERLTRHDALALRSTRIDWIPDPDDVDGWEAVTVLARDLEAAGVPEREWKALTTSCKGDWKRFLDRCVRAAYPPPDDPPRSLMLAIRSARDVTSGFDASLRTIIDRPGLVDDERSRLARDATVGDRSLPAILENSREWHERFAVPGRKGLNWPVPLPRWKHPATGVEIVPLGTSDELIEEGEAMRHCVGDEAFVLGSLQGRSLIVSLRRNGERLSTAEISMDAEMDWTSAPVSQHMGHRNSEPPADAAAALRSYMARAEVRKGRSMPGRDAELPARTDALKAELLEAWRPYLTGRWKRASLGDFGRGVASDPERE